jgi:hypothetical protein
MSDSPAGSSDLRWLGVTRIALGAVFLFRTTPLANLYPSPLCWVAGPLFGWPVPGWHAAWLGLALPAAVVACLCIARTLAALLFMLGVATTASGLVASISAFVVLAQDAFAFSFTRYILFLATGLLAIADGGSCLALRPSPARDPQGSVWLMRSFVASVYAWSAIAKLRPDWLDGRTLGALHDGHFLRGALADWLASTPAMRSGASVAVVGVELALAPLLLIPRTRRTGIALAVLMHGAYELTAQPDVMALVMGSLLLVFLPGAGKLGRPPACLASCRASP